MRVRPQILVQARNPGIRISLPDLQRFAEKALAAAWKVKRANSEIMSVAEIAVTFVADGEMATLHQRYAGVAGTTDVLTFQHGEIVISAETAKRHARKFDSNTRHELQLYLLHGLLHLAGFDDATPVSRAEMSMVQGKIMRLIGLAHARVSR